MKPWLPRFVLLPLAILLIASPLHAGQNAGALARIYWLTSNTTASASRFSNAALVKALVTVKGVHNFRGADVQLVFGKANWYVYVPGDHDRFLALTTPPPAWQGQLGGPAEANYAAYRGGFNGGSAGIWPDVFKVAPAVPNVASSQDGTPYCCLTSGITACLTPNGRGVIWLSSAGSAGMARDPAVEYAVFGFTLDLSGNAGHLAGDSDSPEPVVIQPNYRLPCGTGEKGSVMVTVDGATVKDFNSFENGYDHLYWHSELITPVKPATWSRLRNLYR